MRRLSASADLIGEQVGLQWTQAVGHHNPATGTIRQWGGVFALIALSVPAFAQTSSGSLAGPLRLDWRRIGNPSILRGLPSPAGGPVERVWFSPDGSSLYLRTATGRTFVTRDWERWTDVATPGPVPAVEAVEALTRPESGALVRAQRRRSATVYAFGDDVWRSENEGAAWENVTRWKERSVLGGRVLDLAVSPQDEQRVAAASQTGVWISQDGGRSWAGLNENLPNLPVRKIVAAPAGSRGVRILAGADLASAEELEWYPGQRLGWMPVAGNAAAETLAQRSRWSEALGVPLTAVAATVDIVYAGTADGRLYASSDRGQTWRTTESPRYRVEAIWASGADSRLAIAVLSSETGASRVVRTLTGGGGWDDLTANLAGSVTLSVTADRASGGIYVGTSRGVYFTLTDLRAPVAATPWTLISNALPEAPVRDLRLDESGNQLFAALEGHGVFATLAPHRVVSPSVVHSADYRQRAAAPGALLSVLGMSLESARAGQSVAPVLSQQDGESQIQVPFEVEGGRVALTLVSKGGAVRVDLPLESTSPAILVDRDGSAMLLDGDTGLQLDAMNPAKPGTRIQILASGLGRVTPDWPSGLPAPLDSSPQVIAPVRVLMDGTPVEVTRSILAPGYIGYYLVEVQLPEFLNAGGSELVLEVAGRSSNRVRIYLDR